MRALLCWLMLGAVAFAGGEPATGEKPDDDFFFTWRLATSDRMRLSINKSRRGTVVDIRPDFPCCFGGCELSLTPEQAAAVGKALARTDAVYERLQRTREASEAIVAGKDYRVVFRTDKTGRFEAAVFREGDLIPVTLARDAANTFAPPLQKAVELAKRVDKKVRF
ncbi:hypothetical protein [Planctomyces sp. SH-PL14]|uniref:hypothetical protein n=1 Tax=Planctomyces sp. SH-PL14 TaxID=1632864 RepID=UPI00078D0074|nr:hypothetical protein [Planctomyces sp. SH-PL14]AMV19970.1 hypothetical protein VT03_18880 [Planctomyces sp. SH-PL14]